MVQDENLYQKVIADYRITNSVKKTAQNVGTSLVRTQRILITEGYGVVIHLNKSENYFGKG